MRKHDFSWKLEGGTGLRGVCSNLNFYLSNDGLSINFYTDPVKIYNTKRKKEDEKSTLKGTITLREGEFSEKKTN